MDRPKAFGGARRVVVKIGSAVLRDGRDFDRVTFASLARDIVALREAGLEVVVVCSGAVALGMARLGRTQRPDRIDELQACAAIGQGRLMQQWNDELAAYGHPVAQVLLTRDDLHHRPRFLAARRTLRTLLAWGVVPVINENDTVAFDEIKLGDNDMLSSLVVSLVEAAALVILSDVAGLYDRPPTQPGAARIAMVGHIDPALLGQAGDSTSGLGSGGMRTKVQAVQQVTHLGVPAIIAPGKAPRVLRQLFEGDDVGTWFAPEAVSMGSRKHWIAFGQRPAGAIRVDAGAVKALLDQGRSLLPIGVVAVEGDFDEGDAVRILGPDGVEIARGLVNHSATEVRAALGRKASTVGGSFQHVPEVVHRDDLVRLPGA